MCRPPKLSKGAPKVVSKRRGAPIGKVNVQEGKPRLRWDLDSDERWLEPWEDLPLTSDDPGLEDPESELEEPHDPESKLEDPELKLEEPESGLEPDSGPEEPESELDDPESKLDDPELEFEVEPESEFPLTWNMAPRES